MKEFIKYLKTKPGKFITMIGLILFYITGLLIIFSNTEEITTIGIITITSLLTLILLIGLYHPYKEWKDGL